MIMLVHSCESHSYGMVVHQDIYRDSILSHGAILCTKEQADEYYLMHYRTKGSRNGIRRYQDESGRLTAEGYDHYAEMYGWTKRLKKAEDLQTRANKLHAKTSKLERKMNENIAANYKAQKKSEKASAKANNDPNKRAKAEKAQQKANKAADRLSESNAKLSAAKAREAKAQDKAAKYAYNLQRKEEKMLDYVDKSGALNDKGLEKYTKNGKLTLGGKLKFGSDFVNKENLAAKERTDQAVKTIDGRIKEFDSLTDNPQDKRASLEQVNRYLKDMKDGTLNVEPEQKDKFEKWYNEKVNAEKNETRDLIDNKLSNFDSLSDKEKSDVGTQVFEALAASSRSYQEDDSDFNKMAGEMQNWLVDQVYDKAGSMNAGEYKSGTNAAKAQEKADATTREIDKIEDRVKKDIGYDPKKKRTQAEYERLQAALRKDSTWSKLNIQWSNDLNEVNGAILKDLGFADTPRNRSILYAFGWWD